MKLSNWIWRHVQKRTELWMVAAGVGLLQVTLLLAMVAATVLARPADTYENQVMALLGLASLVVAVFAGFWMARAGMLMIWKAYALVGRAKGRPLIVCSTPWCLALVNEMGEPCLRHDETMAPVRSKRPETTEE